MKTFRIIAWALVATVAQGCSRYEEQLTLRFPDARTRAATSVLTVTAFEPFFESVGNPTGFISCDEVGVYRPDTSVDPSLLGTPGLGRILVERESFTLADGFSHGLALPKVDSTELNPWGAAMVLVEARGEAANTPSVSGGRLTSSLASACYCIRTQDADHRNVELDRAVESACVLVDPDEGLGQRELTLEPVVSRKFRLEACGSTEVSGPRGSILAPGPSVCLRETTCEDVPSDPNCYSCSGACTELDNKRNAPISFEVEGAGVGPSAHLALTDIDGRAEAQLDLGQCSGTFEVTATVLGRTDEQVRFRGTCVEPVDAAECRGETSLDAVSPVISLATVPQRGTAEELVAVLGGVDPAVLQVFDLRGGDALDQVEIAGESPQAIIAYRSRPGLDGAPVVAVATTLGERVRVRTYDWTGSQLVLTSTLAKPCPETQCGSLASCADGCPVGEACLEARGICVFEEDPGGPDCADAPVGCACELRAPFGESVILEHGDFDGDGLEDLSAATSQAYAVTTWLSSRASPTSKAPYREEGCRCGQYSVPATDIALVGIGGAPSEVDPYSKDLVLASSTGSYIRYGRQVNDELTLQCGRASLFGDIILVRDLDRARVGCQPSLDASCEPFEDLLVIYNEVQDGSAFDDPGNIQVVFGGPEVLGNDSKTFDRADTHLRLRPRERAGEATLADPKRLAVADVNGDGHDDVAVLFDSADEVRVWLGSSLRALGEAETRYKLSTCSRSRIPGSACNPLDRLALPDVDGDGRAEMVAVCDPNSNTFSQRLRWYSSAP